MFFVIEQKYPHWGMFEGLYLQSAEHSSSGLWCIWMATRLGCFFWTRRRAGEWLQFYLKETSQTHEHYRVIPSWKALLKIPLASYHRAEERYSR